MALELAQSPQYLRLCMALAKFSYANSQPGSPAPIPWVHLSSRNNLFVTIDALESAHSNGTCEKRYWFKVVQDANSHENVDLTLLAVEARRAINEAQQFGQQPTITIVVRNPCIAMRYPTTNGTIRRFQIRFSKEEDFYETLKLFSIIKVPFVEAGSAPNQTAVIASNQQPMVASNSILQPRAKFGFPDNGTAFSASTYSNTNITDVSNSNVPEFPSRVSSQPVFQAHLSTSQPMEHSAKALQDTFATTSTNVYIPRPSTAPVHFMVDSTSDLPPKRDLPFQRRIKPAAVTDRTDVQHDSHKLAADRLLSYKLSETFDQMSQDQQIVPATKKRAAAKAKKTTAVKRTRTTTSRKKSTVMQSHKTSTTGTETSLQHHDESMNVATATEQQSVSQTLPDKPASEQATRIRNKKDNLDQDPDEVADQAQSVNGFTMNLEPSDNVLSTHRTTSTENPALVNPPSTTPNTSGTKIIYNDTTFTNEQISYTSEQATFPPNQQSTNPPSHISLLRPSLKTLLNDPSFAPTAILPPTATATTKPFDFYALPADEQHSLLENFVIQNLEDENFLKLCKALEGVWQRVFINP